MAWRDEFHPREQKHIQFALMYLENYDHGAPGHLDLTIIAKLTKLLDAQEQPPKVETPEEPARA